MKITQLRDDGKVLTCRLWDVDKLMEQLKVEIKSRPVSLIRQILPELLPYESLDRVEKLPKLLPSVTLTRSNGELALSSYTGLVMIEVNHLANMDEVDRVKAIAADLPQTYAAFCGSSGRSVKIWVRFAYPNNGLPQSDDQIEWFHAHAYRKAVNYYRPLLPFDIELKEPSVRRSCRWTYDPTLYYQPKALPIVMEQPLDMPDRLTYREQVDREESPVSRMLPGYESYEQFSLMFESAFELALEERPKWTFSDDPHALLVAVAEHCFLAGLPEEETVRRLCGHYRMPDKVDLVRTTVHATYLHRKGFDTRRGVTDEQRFAICTEEFMKRRYEFRNNTLTTHVEYRERSSLCFTFRPVDKRAIATMALEAMHEGLKMWDRDVVRYLESDRVPIFRPIEDFLYDLKSWDGIDRITSLAERVKCDNPHWTLLFRRWFLCMVAHWKGMDKKHGNSTSPLLIGPQSCGKSTFCRLLMPKELLPYYTDSIDFGRKRDAELALCRFALINMDEFDQVSPTQQAFLKNLVQRPVVNTRRPNSTTVDEYRRYASFIATSNQSDVLTDLTGNRRFIAIRVTGKIDVTTPIDHNQLYAQALSLLRDGERYWFDAQEEVLLNEYNQEFEQSPPVEQLFQVYYRAASPKEEGKWLLTADIFQQIQKKSHIKMGNYQIVVLGRVMSRLGVETRRRSHGRLYHVVELKSGSGAG